MIEYGTGNVAFFCSFCHKIHKIVVLLVRNTFFAVAFPSFVSFSVMATRAFSTAMMERTQHTRQLFFVICDKS